MCSRQFVIYFNGLHYAVFNSQLVVPGGAWWCQALVCHPLAVIFTSKSGSFVTGTAMCSLQVSPPSSLLI